MNTWIIIDGEREAPFKEKLTFELHGKGVDLVEISGELKEWILATKIPGNLNCTMEPVIDGLAVNLPSCIISRSPQKLPNIIFSEKDSQEINKRLGACKAAWEEKPETSSTEKKKEKEKKFSDAVLNLKKGIELAIGGAILAKEINKSYSDENEIKDSDWEKAQEIYVNICKGNRILF